MLHQTKISLLVVAIALLIFTSSADGQQCMSSVKNIAVREGQTNIIMNLYININNVKWTVKPTSDESRTYTIINYSGSMDATFAGLYDVNQTGLIIKDATAIDGNGFPISTAGLYIGQCATNPNKTGAKLLVVRSGPLCSCATINSTASSVSCNVTYADNYSFEPIYPIVTWRLNGVFLSSSTLQTTKVDAYVYYAESTIISYTASPGDYTCELTFSAPTVTDIQFAYVATNAPEFNESCSTSKIPISMEPSFGPVAGGTNLTIIIGSDTIEYISRYVGSNIWDVRHVYFGEHLSSTLVSLQSSGSSTFEFLAVTPNTTESSTRQPLSVVIEFSPTLFNMAPFNMTSDKTFTYLPNPEITGIFPNNFITSGGTLLDVFGQRLSSVAKPIIQLKVIITRTAEDGSTPNITTTTTSRVCTVPPGNDTYMQCPMPPLYLPDDFLEIINSLYNTNVTRRRRSGDPIILLIVNSHSYLSRMKRDVNVLTVNSSNGRDQAEIFLGFIFDGYREYENFNDAFPDTRITFYSAPEINSSDELIEFDPSEDELIYVKGRYMSRGCRLIDYVVHIGNQICANNDLRANQLSCRPPKVKPSSTDNDTIHCAGSDLSITITVGYKQYQYACLTYTDHSRRLALIIGLTVGLGVFVILLTILIVCVVRCRKNKVREETDRLQHTRGVEFRNIHSQNAERPGSKRDLNIIHTRQNPMTIYKTDYDHEIVLQQESQRDYDKQIQEYDDYLKPNGDYLTSIDDE